MSYHIYTTKGITLSSRPWRESDRIYNILTRELGLLRARALGVRKEQSKLRGALEPLSISSVSLVRGKEFWRITSAESIKTITPSPRVLRPLALLEKFVQGEDPHQELFDAVALELSRATDDGVSDDDFETNLVAQILFHLGYLKESDLSLEKEALVKAINNGIEASQL